jgi:Arylsulfotransferase (ASST)
MHKRHGLTLKPALIVLFLIAAATLSAAAQKYSSSADYMTTWTGEVTDGAPTGSDPVSGGVPQYDRNTGNGYPSFENRWSHVAFEAGGGLTAPIGNDHPFVTYGYNLTVGGGWNFTKTFGTLVGYQFNRNKIPGATLAVVGAAGGNVNTWSFTVDPIYHYGHLGKWGGYVTGGGGFYRKVTNFTDPQSVQYCGGYFYGLRLLCEGGDFKLIGGTDPKDWFYAQHGPDFFSPSNSGFFRLGVMDNGDDRKFPGGIVCGASGSPSCYSAASVYQIDESAMTATLISSYTLPNNSYSYFGGNVQSLANGDLKADFSSVTGGSLIQELNLNGPTPELIWQAQTPGTVQFRSERLPSLYPGVQW